VVRLGEQNAWLRGKPFDHLACGPIIVRSEAPDIEAGLVFSLRYLREHLTVLADRPYQPSSTAVILEPHEYICGTVGFTENA
jgi:hypothetical protein